MNTVKWGVLSTADIAQTQLIPALKRAENAEIIAIASRGPKIHAIAENLEIKKAYESYDELLNDHEVEVIYIPLPNDLHKEWVIKAAKAGKHILCEKPAALNEADLEEMITVCNEENVQFMEAFMYQFHPQHIRVKEIIGSGEIGEVKLYKSSHSFYFENRQGNIRMDAQKGGGAIWDVGCYSVHAMQLILEKEVKSISFKKIVDSETTVDVSAFGIVEMENEIHGMIDCSFDMTERNEYEIVGTKGTIKVKNAFRPDRLSGNGQITINTLTTERIEQIGGDIYKLEVEYFSDAVRTKRDLALQHNYSRQNVRILHAIQQSVTTNQQIELADYLCND
ncbi:Gfo/Idh/MocA family oxidoreductase [Solibacillus sp. FSL W7-1464]|uniref:Gfo/Idh/MocA family protein n=1 Tax=Solibacillus sp. FSL W7-1464 TaxID=2921706 RepID=UPI0030F5C22E